MTDSAASTDDVWTVQRILQWTTGYLQEKGVESARLEAELLLAHARNCQRIQLYASFEDALTDNERSLMRDFVKRRAAHEPLAYITGRKEFYGRDFLVGAGVLVPRPETETLVDVCLERIPKDGASTVCEIGFGSGCIAITLARQRPNVRVLATDISETAAKFASENRAAHNVEDRVELFVGDKFAPLQTLGDVELDGIVSNPPYICEHEMAELSPDVRDHEPREALVSGIDGLDMVRQLTAEASRYLRPGGWLILEVDPAQCSEVANILKTRGYQNTKIHKDLFENDRIVETTLA